MRFVLLITILFLSILSPAQSHKSNASQRQDAAGEPLSLTATEIAALVNECGERTTRMTWQVLNYGYTETHSEYEVDKRGQVTRERSKAYEVNPVRIGKWNYWPRIQIAEDGVALSAEKVARERERIVKELTQAEESAARQENQTQPAGPYKPKFSAYGIQVEKRWNRGFSRSILIIRPTDFLRSHEFYAPRRAVFNDRETILLSFRPRPGYVFDETNVCFPLSAARCQQRGNVCCSQYGIEDYGRLMAQLGGNVWIDEADKVIARLEAMPVAEMTDAGAAAKDSTAANAPLGFEFTRLPDGTWVPSRNWYDSYGRENVFWKTADNRALRFSDFKLFKTSVEVEKLEPSPEKPQ